MTKKQMRVLRFIQDYWREEDCSPCYDDIREFLGVTSNSSVTSVLSALEKGGYIVRQPKRPRSIRLTHAAMNPSVVETRVANETKPHAGYETQSSVSHVEGETQVQSADHPSIETQSINESENETEPADAGW